MLSKPVHGWSDFTLDNKTYYGLSYLDDIAFEWVEQAIHGLETLLPFCVKGFLEPYRMLCTVSYWNCHVIIEHDGKNPLKADDTDILCVHMSMIDFCKNLHRDISENIVDWAMFFYDSTTDEMEEKTQKLQKMLDKLKQLIDLNEEHFGENRCFL